MKKREGHKVRGKKKGETQGQRYTRPRGSRTAGLARLCTSSLAPNIKLICLSTRKARQTRPSPGENMALREACQERLPQPVKAQSH